MRHLVYLTMLVVALAACEEDFDRTKTECGFPGNCCWADLTCNEGYVCNPATKLCEVPPEAGLPDMGALDQSAADKGASSETAPGDLTPAPDSDPLLDQSLFDN